MSKHTRLSEISSNLFSVNLNVLQDIAEFEASVIRGGVLNSLSILTKDLDRSQFSKEHKPIKIPCTCGRTDGQHDPLCGI